LSFVTLLLVTVGIAALAQEQSVKPGINDSFKNPDVVKYQKSFEGESREVYVNREKIVAACGIKPGKVMKLALYFSAMRRIEGIHPLQGGLIRRKYRRDRRPGLPIESPMIFYPRYLWETITKSFRLFALLRCYKLILARVENTQAKYTPVDVALTLATKEDLHTLEIFKATEGVGHRLQQKPL